LDEAVCAGLGQFVTEAVDMDLDDIGDAFPLAFPEVFAQHFAGDNLAGVSHEDLEEAELCGGEFNMVA
jgi:hypothetical protein